MLWAKVAFALLISASSAVAQAPSASLPDTLGANVPAVGKADANAFDYLIGDWTFLFQSKAGASSWNVPVKGTWTVHKSHDGFVVEDIWALEGSPDPTLSWRVFNPARQVWEMQGLKVRRGSWDPGTAWGQGDTRYVTQTFTGLSMARIKYYNIKPGSFSWRADVSTDGGKTWLRDAWIMDATRAPK